MFQDYSKGLNKWDIMLNKHLVARKLFMEMAPDRHSVGQKSSERMMMTTMSAQAAADMSKQKGLANRFV